MREKARNPLLRVVKVNLPRFLLKHQTARQTVTLLLAVTELCLSTTFPSPLPSLTFPYPPHFGLFHYPFFLTPYISFSCSSTVIFLPHSLTFSDVTLFLLSSHLCLSYYSFLLFLISITLFLTPQPLSFSSSLTNLLWLTLSLPPNVSPSLPTQQSPSPLSSMFLGG